MKFLMPYVRLDLLAALALVGCVTANVWRHPAHSDKERLSGDSMQCERVAAVRVRSLTPQGGAPYGVGSVFGNRDPRFGAEFDTVFEECMRSQGYYRGGE